MYFLAYFCLPFSTTFVIEEARLIDGQGTIVPYADLQDISSGGALRPSPLHLCLKGPQDNCS